MSKKILILTVLIPASHAGASTLFEDDTVLEVSLVGPLGSLIRKKESCAEIPFILRVDNVEHSIKLRVRGNSRIKVCNFPPLRLRFSADDTAESVFAGQDKLKLVTHCRLRDSNQTNTLEEYAAYRIFNLISDVGYKVRLLHITYTDTDGHTEDNSFDRYGFLIESESELADRVGGQPAHVDGVTLASLDKRQAAIVLGVIRQVPGLSQKGIEETVEYLDKFFVQANDEDKLLQSFEDRCIS
jgi:hypothetical protein